MKLKPNRNVFALLLTLCGEFYALAGDCSTLENIGERTWHPPGYFANLTIDDPWLKEPYGHLKYEGFLNEMEEANFHTTIAFIPWNYDRCEDKVASLFREHPDRFSVCVHGNNHDHYEFYKYETTLKDSWPEKPLCEQEEDIVQAVARMERFSELTGIDYDRVMVFPHAIAPAETLGLLKKYGFISTVNAGNIPLGSKLPSVQTSKHSFEPLLFENFASLDRRSASTVDNSDIEDGLSRGKPLLFYVHHEFFENGINTFNPIAEMVNAIEPSVQWKSLGYISRHLYLLKKRENGDYDVRSFSKSIELENNHNRDVTYFVQKEETFIPPIKKVTVDGKSYSYKRNDDEITMEVVIPAGESRLIDIEYENDLDIASVDISKDDLRVTILRKLSDFRDMTLATNVVGRTLTHFYYETELYKLGLIKLTLVLLILLTLTISGGWYIRKRFKRR